MNHSFKFIYLIVFAVIVLIVVSLGLFIMKSSQDFVDSANLSLSDTSEFNNMWVVYKGRQKGSDVKMMIQKLITNANQNSKNSAMLPDVAYKVRASDEFSIINSTAKLNNTDDMKELMTDLDVKHYYTVDFVYSETSKQITGIIIKYAQKDKIDFVPDEN